MDGRNEERNGENERPDKVVKKRFTDLEHRTFNCNYLFLDSIFSDSEYSFRNCSMFAK